MQNKKCKYGVVRFHSDEVIATCKNSILEIGEYEVGRDVRVNTSYDATVLFATGKSLFKSCVRITTQYSQNSKWNHISSEWLVLEKTVFMPWTPSSPGLQSDMKCFIIKTFPMPFWNLLCVLKSLLQIYTQPPSDSRGNLPMISMNQPRAHHPARER